MYQRAAFVTRPVCAAATTIFSGYRPQFYFRTTDVTGAVQLQGAEMALSLGRDRERMGLLGPLEREFALAVGGAAPVPDRNLGAGHWNLGVLDVHGELDVEFFGCSTGRLRLRRSLLPRGESVPRVGTGASDHLNIAYRGSDEVKRLPLHDSIQFGV
jgi:hypothetical protein